MEERTHSEIHYLKKASIKVLVVIIPCISLCIMNTYIYIYMGIHIILPKWAHIINDLLITYILKNNFFFCGPSFSLLTLYHSPKKVSNIHCWVLILLNSSKCSYNNIHRCTHT